MTNVTTSQFPLNLPGHTPVWRPTERLAHKGGAIWQVWLDITSGATELRRVPHVDDLMREFPNLRLASS